jgi:DNA invertase Pin-like site-specific DNA recombinase
VIDVATLAAARVCRAAVDGPHTGDAPWPRFSSVTRSTDQQDLTAQHDGLIGLGASPGRIYVDHGLTGTNRDRPGLREALAACREGDTLVVTKLDRLARSLPDPRAIADELTTQQVSLNLGGSIYDPNDAVGRLLFNVLAMVAEFDRVKKQRDRDEGAVTNRSCR